MAGIKGPFHGGPWVWCRREGPSRVVAGGLHWMEVGSLLAAIGDKPGVVRASESNHSAGEGCVCVLRQLAAVVLMGADEKQKQREGWHCSLITHDGDAS